LYEPGVRDGPYARAVQMGEARPTTAVSTVYSRQAPNRRPASERHAPKIARKATAAHDMVGPVVPGYLDRIPCWSSGRVAAL